MPGPLVKKKQKNPTTPLPPNTHVSLPRAPEPSSGEAWGRGLRDEEEARDRSRRLSQRQKLRLGAGEDNGPDSGPEEGQTGTLAAACFFQIKKAVFPPRPSRGLLEMSTESPRTKRKKEKHEGEKNGCRGLRIPKPLGPLCLFCGPERHTTADFSFPYRLPPAADTSAWISGSSGYRTLREKPAKQDQTWGGGLLQEGAEQIWELVARGRCYQVSFLFHILYSAHIIYL